jgi:hypothetical protein
MTVLTIREPYWTACQLLYNKQSNTMLLEKDSEIVIPCNIMGQQFHVPNNVKCYGWDMYDNTKAAKKSMKSSTAAAAMFRIGTKLLPRVKSVDQLRASMK